LLKQECEIESTTVEWAPGIVEVGNA